MKKKIGIVGAGVIGSAIAYVLSKTTQHEIHVIERGEDNHLEASGNNSGVIHSGVHLSPKSKKGFFSRTGKSKVISFCENLGVAYKKTGMYITCPSHGYLTALSQAFTFLHFRKQADQQALQFQTLFTKELRRHIPGVQALFALWIPDVYVIDVPSYVFALRKEAEDQGVIFSYNSEVISITQDDALWRIRTRSGEWICNELINAAGIGAAKISDEAGWSTPHVDLYRGEYYEVMGSKRDLVDTLIYPITKPGSPGLGIHFTKTIGGKLLLGPNATRISLDHLDQNLTPPEVFGTEAKKFFPQIDVSDLHFAQYGIRTKAQTLGGDADFYITRENGKPAGINLLGIESPGLTSSLSIAEYVASLLIAP